MPRCSCRFILEFGVRVSSPSVVRPDDVLYSTGRLSKQHQSTELPDSIIGFTTTRKNHRSVMLSWHRRTLSKKKGYTRLFNSLLPR